MVLRVRAVRNTLLYILSFSFLLLFSFNHRPILQDWRILRAGDGLIGQVCGTEPTFQKAVQRYMKKCSHSNCDCILGQIGTMPGTKGAILADCPGTLWDN